MLKSSEVVVGRGDQHYVECSLAGMKKASALSQQVLSQSMCVSRNCVYLDIGDGKRLSLRSNNVELPADIVFRALRMFLLHHFICRVSTRSYR